MDELKLDPAFTIPGEKSLRLSAETRADAKRFLSFQLARSPDNLRQHAQRIFLLIANQDREPLFGALVDLFIALGEKGEDFRKRLLNMAAPLLSEEDYQFLSQHQKDGLAARDSVAHLKGSVLSKGICGTVELVNREKSAAGFVDSLQEALSLLEFGQVDEARRVLEQAYLSNPSAGKIEDELAEIYRHTKDRVSYDALTEALRRRGTTLTDGWQSLGQDLAKTE